MGKLLTFPRLLFGQSEYSFAEGERAGLVVIRVADS
jgi:hypothetical protein